MNSYLIWSSLGAGEALGDFHVFAGAAESDLVVEIGGFDNQRVSFPMTARIAQP